MTAPSGPPPDHRTGRQDRLLVFLRAATALTLVAAILGVVVPGEAGRMAANSVVVILVAAPLLRVVWLVQRWARIRDWRYVAVAVGLLTIIAFAAGAG
jgi:hypothetical protein